MISHLMKKHQTRISSSLSLIIPFTLLIIPFTLPPIISSSPFPVISEAWAATYYVDATNGNDGNNGLSEAAPWKTISKVNSSTFTPGDQILFKRGEVWREQLEVPSPGSSGNPITFGAYGSGENPLISGPGIDHCITILSKHHITIDSINCKYANNEGIDVNSSTYFTIKNLRSHIVILME